MRSPPRETWIFAAVILGAAWLAGAGLLIASWHNATAADRFHSAPTCATDQAFGTAYCQITIDGRMSDLTSSHAYVDAGGRHPTVPAPSDRPRRNTAEG
jgi:hypothetical protein